MAKNVNKNKGVVRKSAAGRKSAAVKENKVVVDAAKILSDVPSEKCFWANNGWIIKNLQELPVALENMSDETFAYHVNREKNDFGRWITDVIGDSVLAKNIENVTRKDILIYKIGARIAQLKR